MAVKIILTGDGQTFDLDEEIAKDDELLKSVVKSVAPSYANPTFSRENNKDGALIVVRVSKQAGDKGSGALEVLIAAPESAGPVEAMRVRMDKLARRRRLTVKSALNMETEVMEAIEQGKAERKILISALKILSTSERVAADFVPAGF